MPINQTLQDTRGGPLLSVIIPTRNGGAGFLRVLAALGECRRACRSADGSEVELIVVDSGSSDGTPVHAGREGARVIEISPESFDHGATRNLGAQNARGTILVFLTQDAIPTSPDFLSRLTRDMGKPGGADAAFARQVVDGSADPIEACSRNFNYPPAPAIRRREDLEKLGLRACFFSNSAAAIRRAAFDRLGGFDAPILTNEDMAFAYRLLESGGRIDYRPDAVVLHQHGRALGGRFRRYFDIGVFMADMPELKNLGTGREGVRFLRRMLRDLTVSGKAHWIPRALLDAVLRYAGLQLGMVHRRLPRSLPKKLSNQPGYWERRGETG